jgi:hypothetical protein
MLVTDNATNVRQPIEIVDADNAPATGLTYLSSITFAYKRPTDEDWQNVSLVDGSSTHADGGFRLLAGNVYEFCWPDAVVVAGESTLVRYVYDGVTRYDVIESRLSGDNRVVLTQQVIDTVIAQESGEVPTIRRGTQWTSTITIPSITGATAIYFGLKAADVEDDDAILLVRLPLNESGGVDGITRIAGGTTTAASVNVTDAQIEMTEGDDDFTFVMTCEGEASAKIVPTTVITASNRTGFTRTVEQEGYISQWKIVGDDDEVLSEGRIKVRPDIVRAVE